MQSIFLYIAHILYTELRVISKQSTGIRKESNLILWGKGSGDWRQATLLRCMPDDKIDQILALEPTGPHVVALAGDDFKGHGTAQLVVALLDDG